MSTHDFRALTRLAEASLRLIDARPHFPHVLTQALHTAFPRLPLSVDAQGLWVQATPSAAPTSVHQLIAACLQQGVEPTFDEGQVLVFIEPGKPAPGVGALALEAFLKRFVNQLLPLYEQQVGAYWQANAGAARVELGDLRKQLLKAEAKLRAQDGTLDSASLSMIEEVLRHPAPIQRKQGPTVHSVIAQSPLAQLDAPVLAACVFARDTPDAPQVVLYTAQHGLEAFASLATLDDVLKHRLGVAQLAYPVLHTSPLDYFIDGQLERQRQAIREAFDQARRDGTAKNLEALSRALDHSADISALFDLSRVSQTRYLHLWLKHLPSWLRNAPVERQQDWLKALRQHRETLAPFSGDNPQVREYGQAHTQLAYARRELITRLKALGINNLDPDHVLLNTTSAAQTGGHFWSGFFAPSSYAAVVSRRHTGALITLQGNQCTLTQLALENLALLDSDFWLTARITDLQGKAISRITPSQVRRLIRELDFANHYDQMLRLKLVQGPQALVQRAQFTEELKARMRLDALEAQLADQLTTDDGRWLETLLSAPLPPGVASQLHLVGFPVQGVIGLHNSAGVLLYTPMAEDQPRFTRYANERAMLDALGGTQWHAYLAAQVPSEQHANALYDLTHHAANTLTVRRFINDPFKVQYQLQVTIARDNARAQANSTADMAVRDLKTGFLFALDLISFVLPFKFMLPLALSRSLWAGFKALQAFNAEDRKAALQYFMEALTHLLDVSTDVAGSALLKRTPPLASSGQLDLRLALPRKPQGLRLRTDPGYEGVFELRHTDGRAPQYFFEQVGRWYEGKRRPHNDAWHILDPRNPTGSMGQPVKRGSNGQWQTAWIDLLPGGNDNIVQDVIEQYRAADVSIQGLIPDAEGLYRIGSKLYIHEPPHSFNVMRHGPDELQIRASVEPYNLLQRQVRRDPTTGTWEMKLEATHPLWKPLQDSNVHFDWDNGSSDTLKDQATLRALKTVLPSQGKQAVEDLLRSFNMVRAQRQRLTLDVTASGELPAWALEHRTQSMNPANLQRFAALEPLVQGMIRSMRESAGFYPSGSQRIAVANFSQAFLEAFALQAGYRFNSQNSLFRTDLPALLRGDSYSPVEFAVHGGLRITPGSHWESYIESGAIPASLNRRDAQAYADNLDDQNLRYNSQEDDSPALPSSDEDSPPGNPASPFDLPVRLNQRQGFLYLLDTRGHETVGVAENIIFNPRESHLNGGVVGSEVHLGATGGRFPVQRMWLMHSDASKAVRVDRLYEAFGDALGRLQDDTYAGRINRAEYDWLIGRMPEADRLPVAFDRHGVIQNPFTHLPLPE